MILDQTVTRLGGTAWYSAPFRRQGNSAVFVLEVIEVYHSPALNVTLQECKLSETAFSDKSSFAAITSTGIKTLEVSDTEEVLRFKYEFDQAGDAEDAVRFRGPFVSWKPY